MAIPDHVFSNQDALVLGDSTDYNLWEIGRFHPEDGKLGLLLLESFKEDSLLALSETFSFAFNKWKLKNFW